MREAVRVEEAGQVRRLGVVPARDGVLGRRGLDELVLDEPFDRSPLAARVVEGEPGAPQLGEVLQRVLEPPERPATDDRALEQVARAWIPHISDEVLHVLIADRGRERLDREEVNRPVAVLEVVDHRLRKARFDGAGREVEPPRVLTRVVLERQREICEIDVLRIQHACPPASAAS